MILIPISDLTNAEVIHLLKFYLFIHNLFLFFIRQGLRYNGTDAKNVRTNK